MMLSQLVRRPGRLAALVLFAGVAAVYFALTKVGLELVDERSGVAAAWPASGFALLVMLAAERRRWPLFAGAIFLGNLAAEHVARGDEAHVVALAAANTVEPLLAASIFWLIIARDGSLLNRVRALLIATGFATAVSAAIGAATLAAVYHTPFASTWATWLLSDGLGMLLVGTPYLAARATDHRLCSRFEATLAVGSISVATVLMFTELVPDERDLLRYPFVLFSPLLTWLAMRGGWRLTALGLSILSIGAIAGTSAGHSPYARPELAADRVMLVTQLFLAISTGMTLVIAAAVSRRREAETKLADEHTLLSSVLRAATDHLVVATSPDGVITVFNHGAEKMLGYRAGDVIGKQTPLLFHDPTEIAVRAAELGVEPGLAVFAPGTANGSAETRAWTLIAADGRRVPVSLTVTAISDTETPAGYTAIAHDISERLASEAELRDERRRLAESQVAARIGSWELELGTREMWWSPQAFLLHGLAPSSRAPSLREYHGMLAGEDRERMRAVFELDATGDGEFDYVYRVVTRAGKRVLRSRGRFVPAEPALGRGRRMAGTIVDVTAEYEASAALVTAELKLRRSFDESVVPMATLDATGVIEQANRELGMLVGTDAWRLTGRNLLEIVHHDDRRHVERQLTGLIDGDVRRLDCTARLEKRRGSEPLVRIGGALIRSLEGQPLYLSVQLQSLRPDSARGLVLDEHPDGAAA
ncbi:MAG: PAS domain S-box protein [Gaiellales bacterium]